MITAHNFHDVMLRRRFESLTEVNKDYWSFKGNSRREYGHGMFQYPAMMVPQVVEAILKQACFVHPDIERVGDPFSGSGTIMTESMMRGLAFSGTDINPLAVLLCRVKSGPFLIDVLKDKAKELLARFDEDGQWAVEADFPNRDKWFGREVQIVLSKVRRAIRAEDTLWARRFFWVALAETARATSNSRTSTFKLHIRTQEDIAGRSCDPVENFKKALARNIQHYEEQAVKLSESGQLVRGQYQREVTVKLADVRKVKGLADLDIVVTSPPYGDNTSTVPYGQYSYLPLQWVDLCDIDEEADASCLATTYEIDTRSLGGSKRVKKEVSDYIKDRSPAFRDYIKSLDKQPRDRALRVTAFFRDLDGCLNPILKSLRPGGLMVWTLGNRKVGGKRVPLDRILADLLQAQHATLLCKLTRRISSKRMAPKNNIAETISNETILVMRKAV
ncbi:MAG: site-specific DNA-methyltransferase [Pseudomonadota bacterium]